MQIYYFFIFDIFSVSLLIFFTQTTVNSRDAQLLFDNSIDLTDRFEFQMSEENDNVAPMNNEKDNLVSEVRQETAENKTVYLLNSKFLIQAIFFTGKPRWFSQRNR